MRQGQGSSLLGGGRFRAPADRRKRGAADPFRGAQGFVAALVVGAVLLAAPAVRASDDDPWISRDKAFHFDVSLGLASASYAVSAAWLVDARWKALALGGAATLAVGAGKELVDLAGLGDPSWKDFAWDVIGTVAGLALAWGVDLLVGGVGPAHPALSAPRRAADGTGVVLRF